MVFWILYLNWCRRPPFYVERYGLVHKPDFRHKRTLPICDKMPHKPCYGRIVLSVQNMAAWAKRPIYVSPFDEHGLLRLIDDNLRLCCQLAIRVTIRKDIWRTIPFDYFKHCHATASFLHVVFPSLRLRRGFGKRCYLSRMAIGEEKRNSSLPYLIGGRRTALGEIRREEVRMHFLCQVSSP